MYMSDFISLMVLKIYIFEGLSFCEANSKVLQSKVPVKIFVQWLKQSEGGQTI